MPKKFRLIGYTRDELDDIFDTAVWTGLEETIIRAQRNNEYAKAFISDYRDYYVGKKPLSDQLCHAGTLEILASLEENPHALHPAAKRWATVIGVGALLASPFALAAGLLYAGGALLISAAGFGTRYLSNKASARETRDVISLIKAHPGLLRKQLAEAREYMGQMLFTYGAIEEKDIRQYARQG